MGLFQKLLGGSSGSRALEQQLIDTYASGFRNARGMSSSEARSLAKKLCNWRRTAPLHRVATSSRRTSATCSFKGNTPTLALRRGFVACERKGSPMLTSAGGGTFTTLRGA